MSYDDPRDSRNGPDHHTGRPCIEKECNRPAGTAWSPYWCFECNVERMRGVGESLEEIHRRLSG